MSEGDHTVMPSLNGGNGQSQGLAGFDDFAPAEDQSANFLPHLVSLGFIKEAVQRSTRFWCLTAILGMFAGLGVYVMSPHPYQASTTLLLTLGPNEDVNTAAQNNQAIANSRAVAGLAAHELGLPEGADSLLATYTATAATDRVLQIMVSAPSSNQAVLRAGAIATAFLQFRAGELRKAEQLALQSLNKQISGVKGTVKSVSAHISQLSTQPSSPSQQSQLSSLRTQLTTANARVSSLQQAVITNQATGLPATTVAVRESMVMDAAAPLPHSRLKPLVLYAALGLVIGLFMGMGLVAVRALVSDRLRRRDDIARALGAPVRLSVGPVRRNRLLPDRHVNAAERDANVRRIAVFLDRAVPRNSRRAAALAVVPVDDPRAAAECLVSLAVSHAEQGDEVVLADLASGAPAAGLLGVSQGVNVASGYGSLVVAVPDGDDVAPPAGPLGGVSAQRSRFTETVAAACARADLLLILASLDPAIGGDFLSTWTTDAVAVVTAGRSSWVKIEAVGEMVRQSGTRLISAVLVGADKLDESLGTVRAPELI